MATAALVCGIVGLVGFFFAIPSVVAVVLGFVAADRARHHPGPGDGRGRATAGWILGLIGLAAFVVFIVATAVTGGFDDEDISVFSLEVGDCVDMSESEEVEVLPSRACDGSHDAEVYLVDEMTEEGDDYPGRDAMDAEVDSACTGSAFEDYVGTSYRESIYEYDSLYPTEEGWELGDRGYVCLIITATGRPLTSSVEGSGR